MRVLIIGTECTNLPAIGGLKSELIETAEVFSLATSQEFDLAACDHGTDMLRMVPVRPEAGQRQTGVVILIAPTACLLNVMQWINGARPTVSKLSAAGMSGDSREDTAGRRHVRTVLRLFESRFRDADLKITDIADSEGISPEHLCRIFRKATGLSPLQHLNQLRVGEAERQLATTELPIYTVARNAGYHSTAELDRHFGRQHNCTPSSYRGQVRRRLG